MLVVRTTSDKKEEEEKKSLTDYTSNQRQSYH